MDYPLENLGPERFQQLCQALLVKEFRDVQCFPVAQPDGGRDAVAYYLEGSRDEFMVFQVKFVRKPLAEAEPHKWLSGIVEEEAPKVKTLVPRGAKAFYLLTNIPGTAHLDVGSIDKCDEALSKVLEVPSFCWWRDDLNRRLDSAWDLKWVYPEIMTGPNLIRSIVESGLADQKEQRTAAIRAFIRDQYDIDQEVRFKQVELQNRLLDLFIDVPVVFRHQQRRKKQFPPQHILRAIALHLPTQDQENSDPVEAQIDERYQVLYTKDEPIGAASVLLHQLAQKHIPRMVLEGAPGQGKSTITQYICQVHRMRLLKKTSDLEIIPPHHQATPVRIPFKIDLRDLATWLAKKDPFSAEESDEPPAQWRKSLEAFLAAQVRHHSGGSAFTYEDLIAVARLSALLLVFDGLDEVADISRRQEVVDEVIKGVNRLEENAASLQVIVTSRPAAFANSPGLPDDAFPYFQLESVTRLLINEYAEKWLKARKIQGRQSSEFKKILKDKLDQPHLRDLARNPMQLAILLSLIHTRGSSLPDKRTALYDSYIELFFSREAEKSPIVREHRDLLIDIHRFLAWTLHSEAEQGRDRGSISIDRLKDLLSTYLSREGHDTSLTEKLFAGMVERVVALVSRVEGTFEFEVQPLREYFAARFLYETAPYSPPGAEKRGTKPDRFDAIARDFYWLNVARFYAGCFSKGELASLVDRLQELAKEDGYRYISHPRVLAATLLSDWVFTQHPKSVREVVSLVLDGLGLRYVLSVNSGRPGSNSPMILPKKCGRDELIDRCFSLLQSNLPMDFALEIVELIKANSNASEVEDLWEKKVWETPSERGRWLAYGLYLGSLSQIPLSDLTTMLSDDPRNAKRLSLVFRARRLDYCEGSEDTCQAVIDAILDRQIASPRQRRAQSVLDLLTHALDASRYAISFDLRQPVALRDLWERNPRTQFASLEADRIKDAPSYECLDRCRVVSSVAVNESRRSAIEWATDLTPWDNIVESSRSAFGERWVHACLANVAAGIKSSKETCVEFPDLLDRSKSLCRRARYARLRAGSTHWWAKQIEMAADGSDRMLIALIILSWSSASTLINLAEEMHNVLEPLASGSWHHLMRSVQSAISLTREDPRSVSFDQDSLPGHLAERVATAFGMRADENVRRVFYAKYLLDYQGCDRIILEFCQNQALDLGNADKPSWNPNLNLIARSYAEGVVSDLSMARHFAPHRHMGPLPTQVAETIAEAPSNYPSYLVAYAEATCRENVASKIVPVGKIADNDCWFSP